MANTNVRRARTIRPAAIASLSTRALVVGALLAILLTGVPARAQTGNSRLIALEARPIPDSADSMLCGTYSVFEDRAAGKGRKLDLAIAVLPARIWDSWARDERDIVFVDQRGTSAQMKLWCDLAGGDDDVQGYVEDAFDVDAFRRCLAELEQVADLRLYSTPTAMEDLDEVRAALGYDQINLMAGSYGTRASLVYIRSIRTEFERRS